MQDCYKVRKISNKANKGNLKKLSSCNIGGGYIYFVDVKKPHKCLSL